MYIEESRQPVKHRTSEQGDLGLPAPFPFAFPAPSMSTHAGTRTSRLDIRPRAELRAVTLESALSYRRANAEPEAPSTRV